MLTSSGIDSTIIPASLFGGSITFNEDGTGTVTPSGFSTQDFEWTSNEDKSITIDGESFTNTKNKRKEQEFTNSTGDEFLSLTKD